MRGGLEATRDELLGAVGRRERDPCVVRTGPLASVLREFVADWNARRLSTAGRFAGAERDIGTVGAIRWLAGETGLSMDTIEAVVKVRNQTTQLRVADAIVTALERPELFHDGTLTIRPNPSGGRPAREACCGGSFVAA